MTKVLLKIVPRSTPIFETYLYPDSGSGRSGVKVLTTNWAGILLEFQPANNVLAALAQAQNSISVKISGFPLLLTFPAQGTSEAFTFLIQYCKKGRKLTPAPSALPATGEHEMAKGAAAEVRKDILGFFPGMSEAQFKTRKEQCLKTDCSGIESKLTKKLDPNLVKEVKFNFRPEHRPPR
jgi:hypothetical protein